MPLARQRLKTILLKSALESLRRGARLIKMHEPGGELSFFVVPANSRDKGGKVVEADALKLMARPDVYAAQDGLFPGHSQSWRMGS